MSNSALIKQFDAPLGSAAYRDADTIGVNFKNKIINGGFDVWQRGESFLGVTTGNVYTADRWYVSGGTGSEDVSKVIFAPGQTDVPNNPNSTIYIDRDVAANAPNAILGQRIENVKLFSGQTVTLSFYAKAAATKTISVRLNENLDNGGTGDAENAQDVVLTNTWTKYEMSFVVNDHIGATIGSNSYLEVALVEDVSYSTFMIYVANVQLEEGSVATEFEQRPLSVEQMLCYRYYEVLVDNQAGMSASIGTVIGTNATSARLSSKPYKVIKRIIPYISNSGGEGILVGCAVTSMTYDNGEHTNESRWGAIVTTTDGIVNEAYTLRMTSVANTAITADAEL